MIPNNGWVSQELQEEIKKYVETNENETTVAQNLWDAAKVALRGNIRATQAYPKR